MFCVKTTHIHAHVPGLSLAQVLFRSNNFKTAEHILAFFPEGLDVLFVVNLLSREPKLMTKNNHEVPKYPEANLRAAAHTHVVVDKYLKFIFGIIQSQQAVQEFR